MTKNDPKNTQTTLGPCDYCTRSASPKAPNHKKTALELLLRSVDLLNGRLATSLPALVTNTDTMEALVRLLDDEKNTTDFTYLSDTQYKIAISFAILSCTLSLFGSISIMYLVLKTRRLTELYHRLMFGLSSMDLVVTTGILLQTFLVPRYTDNPFAKGNEATCNAAAFLMNYFLASYIYNAELSIYFLTRVRYGKSEDELSKKIEPYVHIIPVFTATLFGILGVALDLFGPHPVTGTCQFDTSSFDCDKSSSDECNGGNQKMAYGVMWAHASTTAIAVLIGIICTWLIYWSVRQQTNRNQRWSFSGTRTKQQSDRIKAVGTQAIWYTVAVLVGFLALVLGTVMSELYSKKLEEKGQISNTTGLYTAYFLLCLLFPLQGFFNWIIYIRPRLVRWKDANPDRSWFWSYQQVLTGQPAPSTKRTAHLTTSKSRIPGPPESPTPEQMTDEDRMETASNYPSSEVQIEAI